MLVGCGAVWHDANPTGQLEDCDGQLDEFDLSELAERPWARYQCDLVEVTVAAR
jgi:hypothetical protein